MKNWQSQLQGREISKEELLEAREACADRQTLLLHVFSQPLVCFTLNIAGSIKQFPLADQTFYEGEEIIRRQLERSGITLLHHEKITDSLGMEGYFVVDADPLLVKSIMIEIEDSTKLARLFDIDVITAAGEKISRESVTGASRRCFLCNEDAHVCAARQRHSPEEVLSYTVETMNTYFLHQFSDYIAGLAVRALLYEVSVSPKPGLVDRFHNGAHCDMDFLTFVDSAAALHPYFRRIAYLSGEFEGTPPELFCKMRYWGKEAESVMLEATGGVNTHKGAIYSLGAICAASAWLHQRNRSLTVRNICKTCSEMVRETMKTELEQAAGSEKPTRGEEQYLRLGLTGIRGEVASGFDSVRLRGLPALEQALRRGFSVNDAGVCALLRLIEHLNDTNIIGRAGVDTQNEIKSLLAEKLSGRNIPAETALATARELDEMFVARNISPGGSADLLSVCFMFYFLGQEKKGKRTKKDA